MIDRTNRSAYAFRSGRRGGSRTLNLDRFGRITTDDWQQDLATDKTVYTVAYKYNRNGNITSAEDNIHTTTAAGGGNGRVDVLYTYDGLNRLTRAKRGHWDGSTVTDGNATGDERWTSIGQTNTAEFYNLDLDGDLNYTDTNEMKDDRTFNIFNELTGRNTDDSGADEYTLSYDANGNRTDDGQSYDIILDAWNRVVEIQDRSDSSTVAEFAYNGLNHKISMHVDTDTDGDVDGSDDIEYYALTQGWQVAAMYLNTDASPTEQYVYNNAGLDGRGGSSTINDMLLRDRDTDANTTLDERTYAVRDHIRGDTVAIIDDTGSVLEWLKYSANGEPTNYSMGDANDSGNVDTTDILQVLNWSNASTYDARGDTDGDGDVDAADVTAVSALSGSSTGYNVLSRSDVNSDFGYTGHRHLVEVALIDMRNRFYGAENQTFIQRDPLGFVDGPNVYGYVTSNPIRYSDPFGLAGCGGGVRGAGGCIEDGQTGGSVNPSCNSWIIDVIKQHPYIRPIYEKLSMCKEVIIRCCVNYGSSGCRQGMCAKAKTNPRQVVICICTDHLDRPNCPGFEELVNSVAHELIHGLQTCTDRILDDPRTTCNERRICDEITASCWEPYSSCRNDMIGCCEKLCDDYDNFGCGRNNAGTAACRATCWAQWNRCCYRDFPYVIVPH